MNLSVRHILILLLLSIPFSGLAQEIKTDSLPPLGIGNGSGGSVRNYDGYLLDLSEMNILPDMKVDATRHTLPLMPLKSVIDRLNLKTGVTYSTLSVMGSYPAYHVFAMPYTPFSANYQTATFRLRSGGSVTLMGDYGYDGRRRSNTPSIFHNVSGTFRGGFQYKSPSSGFSFSVQVHAGRGGAYPY